MRWLRAGSLDTILTLPEGYWPVLAELVQEYADSMADVDE
jgi:hypothetical protein